MRLAFALFVSSLAMPAGFGQNKEFDIITLDEFKRQLSGTSDGAIQIEKIRGALASGRQDFIHACWDSGGTASYTRDEILKLPEGVHKDTILLMLLRTYPGIWPDPMRFHWGSRGMAQYMTEPYVSFIKKYLPDTTPDESLVATPAVRLALADRLEAALSGKVSDAAPSPAGAAPVTKEAVPDAVHHAGAPKPSLPSSTKGYRPSHLWWWLAVPAALAALLLLLKSLKARK